MSTVCRGKLLEWKTWQVKQLDQNLSTIKWLCVFYKRLLPNNNLFAKVNFFHLLQHIGYDENELDNYFNSHLENLSNLLVLYPDGYPVVILITLPDGSHESTFINGQDVTKKLTWLECTFCVMLWRENFCDMFTIFQKILAFIYT